MKRPHTRLLRALEIVAEQGCAIGDEDPLTSTADGQAEIVCSACGQTFRPATVLDLG